MKTTMLIILILFIAGCTSDQMNAFLRGMGGAGQGVNNAVMLDAQLRQQQPMQVYYPQQNNGSTYWQEQRARQEYYDNVNRKLFPGVPLY